MRLAALLALLLAVTAVHPPRETESSFLPRPADLSALLAPSGPEAADGIDLGLGSSAPRATNAGSALLTGLPGSVGLTAAKDLALVHEVAGAPEPRPSPYGVAFNH